MTLEIHACRIGDRGTAKSTLAPSGVVEVDGKDFSARAVGGVIESGSVIVVTDGDIGGLVVQAYRLEFSVERLPRFGQPAFGSFGDKAKAKAAEEQEQQRQALETWLRTARLRQRQIGAVFAALAVGLLNPPLVAAEIPMLSRVVYGLAFFAGAFAWAAVVFRSIDHIVRQFDEECIRLISVSTCLALSGSAFGLWSIQSLGVLLGLGLTVAAALVGALIVPLLAVLCFGE